MQTQPGRSGRATEVEVVEVQGVIAVSDGLTLICEVHGRRIGVPHALIVMGSQVRRVGDSGTLRVPHWFAQEHGLA